MILEGKTYRAIKQGNGTNLLTNNHSFTLSNVTSGAFDWGGIIAESSALSFGDNTATRTATCSLSATFPAGGWHTISVYVKYDDLGAPDLVSPADFVFTRSGQISGIPTGSAALTGNVYRLWWNVSNGAGISLTTIGIGKTTAATFNSRSFKAYGLQIEHATSALDEPSDYTPTSGVPVTTPAPVKLNAFMGGVYYKPVSLLAETDAIISRAIYEGYTLPSDNNIYALDNNIRERINEGIWQETDYRLMPALNNAALSGFGLINLKSPWSITNLAAYSNDLGNPVWLAGGGIKIPNTLDTAAPDGTFTACKFDDTGATNPASNVSIIANASVITYSIYTKKGTVTTRNFLLRNETTGVNFTTGTLNYDTGIISGLGWSVKTLPNGWYRISYTQSTGISIGNTLRIYIGRLGASGGSTQTWYIWMPQVEDRDKASKEIITGSTPIYGNGIATAHGGVTYTVNGFNTGGVDGYLNLHYNPSKTGVNYQANRGGVGVVLYSAGGYPISQDAAANSTSLLTPSSSAVQRINNVSDLGASIDFSGTGTKHLQRTGAGTGEYTNNGVDGSFAFTNSGALTDRFFNVGRIRASSAYAYSQTRVSIVDIYGNLTAAQRQKSRDIDNKYFQRIGLPQIA